jgi:ABC-type polysaccharide/polyol phosphate transport system ATPase subunit
MSAEHESPSIAIELENVSLTRRTREEHAYNLKARLFSFLKGTYRRPRRKTVLEGLTLSLPFGAHIGLIGANGSGKSTLLRVIAGILPPSGGAVKTSGRIAPLIELGAGFEPDLSVQENIILYGVLLGATRGEMRSKLEEIIRFAELEEYRHYPVRSLSSGMAARLAFAVATDVDPQILLLDEVLSVGDEAFRRKSRRRIDSFISRGVTVIIVSHDLGVLRQTCKRTIWLDAGKIRHDGPTEETIAAYLRTADEMASTLLHKHVPAYSRV